VEPTRSDHRSEVLPVEFVVRAIGYSSTPIPGLPEVSGSGVVPSDSGRILEGDQPISGMYVTGWLRRGPSGVIGTNRPDANAVAESIVADLPDLPRPTNTPDDIAKSLADRNVRVISWQDWLRLDAHERELGEQYGCDPVALHDRKQIIEAIDERRPS
jgi:ferredoxin--NADP+ reductase